MASEVYGLIKMAIGVKHNIIKNLSSLIIAQIIYKLLTFVTIILIARFLGVEKFGLLSYGLSFVWIFLFLSDMGLSDLFIRDVSRKNELIKEYINNIVSLKIVLAAISLAAIILCVFCFSLGIIKSLVIVILGISVILDSFTYFFRCLFRVKGTMEYEGILMAVEATLKLAAILIVAKCSINAQEVILTSSALLLASLFNLCINYSIFLSSLRSILISFNIRYWMYLLRQSYPFALILILCFYNFRIDTVMLSLIKTDAAAGLYNANYKIIEQALLIPVTFSIVSFPVFSKYSDSIKISGLFISRIIFPAVFLSIILITLFYLYGNWIIRTIYGMEFLEARQYLFMQSWIILPFFLKSVLEKLLLGLRRQSAVLIAYFTGMILKIPLNLFLIPHMGINGASLGTLICESFMVCACLFILNTQCTSPRN